MVNEFKRRFFNREMLIWAVTGVVAEIIILTYVFYVRFIFGHSIGEVCALDAFDSVSGNYVFPFLMLIAALCNQRMMKCDRDPMIILKYSSKQGIYFWQTICALAYSFMMSLVYVVTAIVYGYIRFKVFYNWDKDYSYFANYSLSSTVTDTSFLYVILMYLISMTLLLMMTCMLGIIVEIISDSDVISGAAIIIFAGIDVFKPVSYSRLVFYETTWLNDERCIRKMLICIVTVIVFTVVGYFLQRRREYYEYKKEDE